MSTSSGRRALAAIVVAAAVVGVLALVLPSGASPADAFDDGLRASGVSVLTPLIELFNWAGSLPIWAGLVVLVALLTLLTRRRPGLAIETIVASVAAEVVTTVVRVVVARPRPPLGQGGELLVTSGFPSGHVSRTVVLMAALLIAVPWIARHRRAWLAGAIAAVAFMGLSRVFAGAHYTSDVLGGALLGCVVVGVWALWRGLRGGDSIEAPPGTLRRRGAG